MEIKGQKKKNNEVDTFVPVCSQCGILSWKLCFVFEGLSIHSVEKEMRRKIRFIKCIKKDPLLQQVLFLANGKRLDNLQIVRFPRDKLVNSCDQLSLLQSKSHISQKSICLLIQSISSFNMSSHGFPCVSTAWP